jgi:hypothetical protein
MNWSFLEKYENHEMTFQGHRLQNQTKLLVLDLVTR